MRSNQEHYLFCFLVTSKQYCRNNTQTNCMNCTTGVDYGLSPPENGYSVCVGITIATVLFGCFGILSNMLTITVLIKKADLKRSITTLILVLAFYDLTICCAGIGTNISFLLALGDISRTKEVLWMVYGSLCLLYTLRTASMYTTVLITLERFLAVRYPCQSNRWFRRSRAILYSILVLLFSATLSVHHWGSYEVSENKTYPGDETGYPNKLSLTNMAPQLKRLEYGFVVADFLVPLVSLLTLNTLLFLEIRKGNAKRVELSISEKCDISIAKMFTVVFAVLLFSHIPAICQQFLKVYKHRFPKEMAFSTALCTVMNSSVNFLIYCALGSRFRAWCMELICDPPRKSSDRN